MDTFSCLGRRELALLHLYDIHPDRSYPVVATSSALWCLVSCQLPGGLPSFKVLIYYSLLNPQVFREPGPVGLSKDDLQSLHLHDATHNAQKESLPGALGVPGIMIRTLHTLFHGLCWSPFPF